MAIKRHSSEQVIARGSPEGVKMFCFSKRVKLLGKTFTMFQSVLYDHQMIAVSGVKGVGIYILLTQKVVYIIVSDQQPLPLS